MWRSVLFPVILPSKMRRLKNDGCCQNAAELKWKWKWNDVTTSRKNINLNTRVEEVETGAGSFSQPVISSTVPRHFVTWAFCCGISNKERKAFCRHIFVCPLGFGMRHSTKCRVDEVTRRHGSMHDCQNLHVQRIPSARWGMGCCISLPHRRACLYPSAAAMIK